MNDLGAVVVSLLCSFVKQLKAQVLEFSSKYVSLRIG